MSVKVTNKEARIHSIATKGKRGFVLVKPGVNYFADEDWNAVKEHAQVHVDAGTLAVQTGVTAPKPDKTKADTQPGALREGKKFDEDDDDDEEDAKAYGTTGITGVPKKK